jgi:hypothetical protein
MSSLTPSVRRRLGGGAVLASAAVLVAASLSSAPAGADAITAGAPGCPTLRLDNPPAGAQISAGDYIVSGQAYDPNATTGTGVGRVEIFFGARETGGLLVGSAIPGQTNTVAPGQLAQAVQLRGGFTTKINFPSSTSRGDNLVAYAYSSSSGAVTSVAIPVLVGVQPTPTPKGNETPTVPQPVTSSTGCTAGAAVAPAGQAPAPAVSGSPAAVTGATGTQPVLRVDNPKSGDLLPVGDTIINGVAFDPGAPAGTSGVDQVTIFNGRREAGGRFLGSGTTGASGNTDAFAVKASVTLNMNGAGTLAVYAHSSITGQESVVTIPVFFGTPPTPTPR